MRSTLIILLMCVLALTAGAYLLMTPGIPAETATMPIPDVSEPVTDTVKNVPFVVIDSGTNASGVTTRKNVAAHDAESFARLWKMVHANDSVAMPTINFDTTYVIGVFAGQKQSGGYGIRVTGVEERGDTRTVNSMITGPGTGCVATQALTSPYQIITLSESGAAHRSIDEVALTPCT